MNTLDLNYEAQKEFDSLLNLFRSSSPAYGKTNLKLDKNYPIVKNNYNSECYPTNFGGAYYDREKEKLVFELTKETNTNQLEDFITSKNIIFHEVNYSLVSLLNYMEMIYKHLSEYKISKCSLNQRNQKITVYFSDDSKKDNFISFLKTVNIPLDIVYFPNQKIIYQNTATTIAAGDGFAVNNKTGELSVSIGCNAYRTSIGKTTYGILTAGHVYGTGYTYYTRNGVLIGQARNCTHKYGDRYDAMFIPFTNQSDYSPTSKYLNIKASGNKIVGNITSIAYVSTALEGTLVSKYGMKTGRTTGCITDANTTFSIDGIEFKDFFDASCFQLEGDSGCPIGIETGSAPNKEMEMLGIATQAYRPQGDPTSFATCCKMTNIFGNIAFPV